MHISFFNCEMQIILASTTCTDIGKHGTHDGMCSETWLMVNEKQIITFTTPNLSEKEKSSADYYSIGRSTSYPAFIKIYMHISR